MLTLRLSVLHELFPCTTLRDRFCIAEVESVYCAVRTKSLYKIQELRLYKVKFVVQWDLSTNALYFLTQSSTCGIHNSMRCFICVNINIELGNVS